MNQLENLVNYLHMDTGSLQNAPTNKALIESTSDELLKRTAIDLTPGERQGFLEIWQLSQVSTLLGELTLGDLAETASSLQAEITAETAPEKRALDLRFLSTKLEPVISLRLGKQNRHRCLP